MATVTSIGPDIDGPLTLPPAAAEYDPRLASLLMQSAALAYCNFSPEAHRGYVDLGQAILKGKANPVLSADESNALITRYKGWKVKVIEAKSQAGTDIQAIVLRHGDQAIVSFRGTHDVNDFITCDSHYQKTSFANGQVHKGFLAGMQSVRGQLIHELADGGIKQVYMGSHSLGAALQELFMVSLPPELGGRVQASYGFGKPNVGDLSYAENVAKNYPRNFAVNKIGDPVPELLSEQSPVPGIEGYVPSGHVINIDEHGAQVQLPPAPEPPAQSGNFWQKAGRAIFRVVNNAINGTKALLDIEHRHYPGPYCAALKQKDDEGLAVVASVATAANTRAPEIRDAAAMFLHAGGRCAPENNPSPDVIAAGLPPPNQQLAANKLAQLANGHGGGKPPLSRY